MSTTDRQLRLGLRANLSQFCLLVAVNALVGGMVGQEQTVLPLLAEQEFHLTGYTFLLTYVFAFGITKAATNYFAGTWSDRFGRKPVLLAGWLLAVMPGLEASSLLEWHRWLGTISAGVTLVAALATFGAASRSAATLWTYRIALFAAGGLVTVAGHLGGLLVWGADFMRL